jgi:NAD(P)-dependent dehydrogenase (short-subunit alcohol dehydrogenase family)
VLFVEAEVMHTLFNLENRVALVTGGNKGLGRAMAGGLAQAGANVFIASRNEDELKQACKEIESETRQRCEYTVVDVGVRADIDRLGREVLAKYGKVDILINNAGMNFPQAIDEVTDEVWDRVLEVNLTSVMSLTRAMVPSMKARRWGRVIHISSIMGRVSKEARNAYSTTKTALQGLARASALDLGPFGITVNCLAPGPFLTDMPMSMLSEADKKAFEDRTALGRWAQPDELIGPMLLLASEEGSYITGQTIYVDGGYTAR